MHQNWRDLSYKAADGLSLYARDYGPQDSNQTPVLCLSGLTRTSREFHSIATHLAKSRRVICPDYRGRGKSAWAPDWQTYMPVTEMADILALLDKLEIGKAAVIGTSRGGIIAMLMGAMHQDRLAGVVLNDIGPAIDPTGLTRILPYVGRSTQFTNWPDAVAALKTSNTGFDDASEADWEFFARFVFAEEPGRIFTDYDPNLAKTLPTLEQINSGLAPDMWPVFMSLSGLPVGVVRGANSDFLSPQTTDEMARTIAGLEVVTIARRGHTPFLTEPEAVHLVERTLARVA